MDSGVGLVNAAMQSGFMKEQLAVLFPPHLRLPPPRQAIVDGIRHVVGLLETETESPLVHLRRHSSYRHLYGRMDGDFEKEIAELIGGLMLLPVQQVFADPSARFSVEQVHSFLDQFGYFLPDAKEDAHAGIYDRNFFYVGQAATEHAGRSAAKSGLGFRIRGHFSAIKSCKPIEPGQEPRSIYEAAQDDPRGENVANLRAVVMALVPQPKLRNRFQLLAWDSMMRLLETIISIRYNSFKRGNFCESAIRTFFGVSQILGMNNALPLADRYIFNTRRYDIYPNISAQCNHENGCKREFTSIGALIAHLSYVNHNNPTSELRGTFHIDGELWYRCVAPGCSEILEGKRDGYKNRHLHMANEHPDCEIPRNQDRSTIQTNRCQVCLTGYPNPGNLKRHYETPFQLKNVERRKEGLPPLSAGGVGRITLHLQAHCETCDRTYDRPAELRGPMRTALLRDNVRRKELGLSLKRRAMPGEWAPGRV
ncbi:hypothetical protein BJ508DRAFT_315282 [Ascobolus immersus RN42]|uniref:Uncharacterized protein n=1 Tax=Ascobolus immersus RN42 TaxID=1160509 RepID=A0A3N4HBL1_ASCIM|nr:hypothetical protein BJ508DRAFT_315282 [Ascobolus immersus RN42]